MQWLFAIVTTEDYGDQIQVSPKLYCSSVTSGDLKSSLHFNNTRTMHYEAAEIQYS